MKKLYLTLAILLIVCSVFAFIGLKRSKAVGNALKLSSERAHIRGAQNPEFEGLMARLTEKEYHIDKIKAEIKDLEASVDLNKKQYQAALKELEDDNKILKAEQRKLDTLIANNKAKPAVKKPKAKATKPAKGPAKEAPAEALSPEIEKLSKSIKFREDDLALRSKSIEKHKADASEAAELIVKKKAELNAAQAAFDISVDSVKAYTASLSGPLNFKYRGVEYYGFITSRSEHLVRLHWQVGRKSQPFLSLGNLYGYLQQNKQNVLMLTNAGMYTSAHAPQGLYISEKTKPVHLDTTKPKNGGNFYLQPNGVYWIDYQGASHIDTTDAFKGSPAHTQYQEPSVGAKYATQSGPMLVINGKINKEFTKGSVNRKVRSGVGLQSPDRVVFLCTVGDENFYSFSQAFRDVFGCKNALFLDGAISKMYLPGISNHELKAGPFGPMISVTQSPNTKKPK